MRNKITRKILAGLLLTVFTFSNTVLTASIAMEDAGVTRYGFNQKPDLRTPETQSEIETSLQLQGDVSFTKKNTPVTLSLRDSDVKQVLRMFADKAGMNIIFHSSVAGTVTLDLVDVPLTSAFEMVMEISELNYVVNGNTIIVAKAGTEGFNMGKQEMTLIPVKYLDAGTLATFLNKNIYGIHKPGFSGTDVAVTNPATNEILIFGTKNDVAIAKKVVEKFDKKPSTVSFKVNYTTPAEMANMVCNLLMPAASGSVGGSSGGSSSGGSSGGSSSGGSSSGSGGDSSGGSTGGAAGIVTGFAIASSDGGGGDSSGGSSGGGGGSSSISLNESQIACTTGAPVTGASVESLGLQNLSVSYITQLGTVSVTGGSEQQVEMIKDFIVQNDKKQPQAYLEVSILELNEDGSKTFDNQWTMLSSFFSASFNGAQGLTSNPEHPIFIAGDKYPVVDMTGDAPEEKYTVTRGGGPLTLAWAINYLISNKKGRVVANPRIIITNGQESTIDLTSDYIESTESEMTASATGSYVTRTYTIGEDAGIKVGITPFISPDGYVTLNIKPEYATIASQETATDSGGSYIAATLLQRRNLDLKNVRIKDGDTLVIGGLIQEEETKTVSKIPVLGDLPVIGSVFRSTTSGRKKHEMVIMITPKIITDTEDAVGNIENL